MKLLIISIILFLSILASAEVRIAVIDTGVKTSLELPICKTGSKSFFNNTINDEDGHGSIVTQLINAEAKKVTGEGNGYCFIIVKVFGYSFGQFRERFSEGVEYVSTLDGVDIVNISGGGYTFDKREKEAVEKLLDKKVLLVMAAGNEGKDLNNKCNYYPACYDKRNVVVGQSDSKRSNFGKVVNIKLPGKVVLLDGKSLEGTSFSTARATGNFVRIMNKKKKKGPPNIDPKRPYESPI